MRCSGVPERCRPRKRRCVRGAVCALLFLSLAFGIPSGRLLAAQVVNVQVSIQDHLLRFVFDADGPVMVDQPVLDSQNVILLPFPGMAVQTDASGFWKPLPGVESIRFYDWNLVTVARISLRFPVTESRVFTLTNPNRVVLDLYLDPESYAKISSQKDPPIDGEVGPQSSEPDRTAPSGRRDALTEASSIPLGGWLSPQDPNQYQSAVLLLGGLLLLGIVASVLLSIRKGRNWSEWPRAVGEHSASEIELIELDSMIQHEMDRYERLSRLEQSR